MRPHATLLLALGLAACGPTVMYHRAPDARIEPASRWAWSPPDRDGLSVREGALVPEDSVARMIRDAIEAQLVAQGFPRTVPESAQFMVHFHVGVRTMRDTLPPRDDPSASGGVRTPGTWGGYGRPEDLEDRVVSWQEGMLVIDAVTVPGGIVAWRGAIAGEVPARAEARPRDAIAEAVRRVMRGFP